MRFYEHIFKSLSPFLWFFSCVWCVFMIHLKSVLKCKHLRFWISVAVKLLESFYVQSISISKAFRHIFMYTDSKLEISTRAVKIPIISLTLNVFLNERLKAKQWKQKLKFKKDEFIPTHKTCRTQWVGECCALNINDREEESKFLEILDTNVSQFFIISTMICGLKIAMYGVKRYLCRGRMLFWKNWSQKMS